MSKQRSWKVLLKDVLAIIGVIALIFEATEHGAKLKEIFWGQPKPQILAAENCNIWLEDAEQQLEFELLVNNPGSKNVSMISFGLIWPDGRKADLNKHKPSLPMTIPAEQTVRIPVWGYCRELDVNEGFRDRFKFPKDQTTLEGTVVVKFNTNGVIKKKITFPLERSH